MKLTNSSLNVKLEPDEVLLSTYPPFKDSQKLSFFLPFR